MHVCKNICENAFLFKNIFMYVSKNYIRMYVKCMYVCMYVRIVRMYVCIYLCTCVRMYVCMYAFMCCPSVSPHAISLPSIYRLFLCLIFYGFSKIRTQISSYIKTTQNFALTLTCFYDPT